MPVSRITREDMVEQSVTDYIRAELFTERDYPTDRIEVIESFRPGQFEALTELDKSYVALGFNYDTGGEPAEMGSTLRRRRYSVEVWVIAVSPEAGRNLAYAIRDALEHDGIVPLLDLTVDGRPPFDALIVDPVRVERQPVPDPKPWQENVWLVTVPLIDEFYA